MFWNKKPDPEAVAADLANADYWDRQAAEHRAALARYRKGSDDPAADRYMIDHHLDALDTCQHNASSYRNRTKSR